MPFETACSGKCARSGRGIIIMRLRGAIGDRVLITRPAVCTRHVARSTPCEAAAEVDCRRETAGASSAGACSAGASPIRPRCRRRRSAGGLAARAGTPAQAAGKTLRRGNLRKASSRQGRPQRHRSTPRAASPLQVRSACAGRLLPPLAHWRTHSKPMQAHSSSPSAYASISCESAARCIAYRCCTALGSHTWGAAPLPYASAAEP
jgi:hypothetical protein